MVPPINPALLVDSKDNEITANGWHNMSHRHTLPCSVNFWSGKGCILIKICRKSIISKRQRNETVREWTASQQLKLSILEKASFIYITIYIYSYITYKSFCPTYCVWNPPRRVFNMLEYAKDSIDLNEWEKPCCAKRALSPAVVFTGKLPSPSSLASVCPSGSKCAKGRAEIPESPQKQTVTFQYLLLWGTMAHIQRQNQIRLY